MEKKDYAKAGGLRSALGAVVGMLNPILAAEKPQKKGILQEFFGKIVGNGRGAGMGLLFVIAGAAGILITIFLSKSESIRELEERR